MAFVMMGATLDHVGGAPDRKAWQPPKLPGGVRPVRRIVTIDDEHGKSRAIEDGPCPDVLTDPARPGFSATRIWLTDRTPARITGIRETSETPLTFEPPAGGSVCWILALPPDGAKALPPMRKTETLDLCLVLEGEVTLVLDTADVSLKAGDTVIQRATNHAWSNVSSRPAIVAVSSHDARA